MGMAAVLVKCHKPFELTFISPFHVGSTWNFTSIGLAVSKEKQFEMLNLNDIGSMPMNNLDLWHSHRRMPLFSSLHLSKSIRDQIWHCRKVGQGQPRFIIWANLAEFECPTLHTQFQRYRSIASEEEGF